MVKRYDIEYCMGDPDAEITEQDDGNYVHIIDYEESEQRIADLERRNAELLQFQDRTLRGLCVCSSDGTDREHYPGCRLRDVARIAELERRNGELEESLAVLFDGYAVLNELTQEQRRYTSPENVSAVLDAVVRIQKSIKATQHPQGESNEQQS